MRTVLGLSLLMFIGCASAPASHRTPNEWPPTEGPVAQAGEPSLQSKPTETRPTIAPVFQTTSTRPTSTAPTGPAPAAPAEPQPVVEDKPTAQPVPVDPKQASIDRAKAAMTLLDNAPSGVRAAVCNARGLLEQVPEAYRKEPEVIEAQKRLKSKEPAALREELAEFEENRMYLCRDNTPSPTCHCNGPKKGCCSYHGGVAGCEPLPTEISCP